MFGISRYLREKQFQMAFGNATLAIIAAMFVTGILKIVFGRMRPFMFEALGHTEFRPFSLSDTFHSFPSGHTAAALAFLVSLGIIFPKIRWATWTISIFVALSRIAIGAHWPSDVVIGALVGTAAAYFIIYVRKKYLAYLLEKRQK
jgi:membrane-associated phospholipid phosphatase